jgi:2-oxo-4-hydroxy-4-carboxy-5-ureidoimidazoline decarboxylase
MNAAPTAPMQKVIAFYTRMAYKEAPVTTLCLPTLNNLDCAEFTRTLGGLFENSPWIAERAWSARPFASIDDLHHAMVEVARRAPRSVQLALLRAHPDLAGRAARAGAMSASSVAEQTSAGLDRLSDEEYERFNRLNAAYRDRFGFPFIIAVRRHDKAGIFAAFEERLAHTVDQEIGAALDQVADITRMRLDRLLGGGT